jgi:RimJ/RimL family protein N-acetyltransferase
VVAPLPPCSTPFAVAPSSRLPPDPGAGGRYVLETARLGLRLPSLDDEEPAAELLTDPAVMRFLGGKVVPREHVREVIAKWLRRWDEDGLGPFVIERRRDLRFIGRAGFLVWDTRGWTHSTLAEAGRHAQPELGWALARAHWGAGYATEAARAVRDWAREERQLRRLISLIAPGNVASQRVAERLGATPTDTVMLFDSGEAVVWAHPETADRVE